MSDRYEAVIGLEVHAQLLTKSKIFCGCATTFGAAPNSQTCPVCLGLPGVLPVLNRGAVEMALKAGLATHGQPAPGSRFARKNYFYPDLPKGYQISQYELPLVTGGYVEFGVNGSRRRVGLHRIHLEEDAGKNLHEGIAGASHLDFNRCGVPLIEVVSEPEIRSPAEATAYLKTLRDILVYLEVCDGNMEEGSLRCDGNISLRPRGTESLGVKVEVKNLNSFKFIQKALEYEITRQTEVLESGGRLIQETRLFDPEQGRTFSMRSKEEAHDYRYFPEPDLVPVAVDRAWVEAVQKTLPELPDEKRARFVREYGLPEYDAGVLASSRGLADYFEAVARKGRASKSAPKTVSNWVMGEILRLVNEEGRSVESCPIRPEALADLLDAVEQGVVSGTLAKAVCEEMYRTGRSAQAVIEEKGLRQVSDEAELDRLITTVLAAHPDEARAYQQGKVKLFGFLVGQVMKASGGKANPARLKDLLKRRLASREGQRQNSNA